MSSAHPRNRLIQSIPASYRKSFVADLQPMEIEAHVPLAKAGEVLSTVYFPVGAVISAIYASSNATIEVHGVGRDGMLGAGVLFTARRTCFDWTCQIAGPMLSMPYSTFERHARQQVAVQRTISLYAMYVVMVLTQTVACNGLHTIAQRAACRLLIICDRVGAPEFSLTHALLAQVLGAHRPSVSLAVNRLQRLGIIRYRFGRIAIIDKERLELESCECYRLVARKSKRIFGPPASAAQISHGQTSSTG